MNLYDIAAELRAALDAAEDGELSDEALAKLDGLELALESKVDSICGLLAEWRAEADARRQQAERLRRGVEARERNAARLKEWLRSNLERLGVRRADTALWRVSVAKSPPSVQTTLSPDQLPERYRRVRVEVDAALAQSDYRATGQVPAGFELRQGEHIVIR